MPTTIKSLIVLLFLYFILSACSLPAIPPDSVATLQAVYTEQSGTVQALQTIVNKPGSPTPVATLQFPTMISITALPGSVSHTPIPQPVIASITPLPIFIPLPSLTPIPSFTPLPRRTLIPTYTAIPNYCNWAAFIKDVTFPDGSIIAPGANFTKTWRLKNIGTCTWKTNYGLVFLQGNNLNGVGNVNMPIVVQPGKTVDISIVLTAPNTPGTYRGEWLLRNSAGDLFGLGPTAEDPFFIEIKVAGATKMVLDFSAQVCDATWRSGAGELPCPGDSGSDKGFVIAVDDPQLENGEVYYGSGIYVAPQNVNNGFIQGHFPAYNVRTGDRFRTVINCAYMQAGCNAYFRLDYQIRNGPIKTIWRFNEAYDGQYYSVDTDLSFLEGNSVKFILTVLANGSAANDQLIWVQPRIEHH